MKDNLAEADPAGWGGLKGQQTGSHSNITQNLQKAWELSYGLFEEEGGSHLEAIGLQTNLYFMSHTLRNTDEDYFPELIKVVGACFAKEGMTTD